MTRKISTKEIVYDAILELHALERVVTRELLSEMLDLKMNVIDDRIKTLRGEEKIRSVQRGVYVPVEQYPPSRIISLTELPDGCVIVDVGDQVLKLYPREARTLASMMGAKAMQSLHIDAERYAQQQAFELESKIRTIQQQLKAISAIPDPTD